MAKPNSILPNISEQDAQRFWQSVDVQSKHECWKWHGSRRSKTDKYGVFFLKDRKFRVNRIAYSLHHAVTDFGNLFVCHSCNIPDCCNPAHLYLGTHLDNMADRKAAGRYVVPKERKRQYSLRFRGEGNHGGGKLKSSDIPIIRERFTNGETKTAIAKSYGVTDVMICNIINGKAWSHI
jgi:hypothetical protein